MRSALIFCAVLAIGAVQASGQVAGFVESIGLEGFYRPGCWTRMIVVLRPESGQSSEYVIRVKQQDLDRDRVIFQRTISLTGVAEGGAQRPQRFEIYFRPQPTDRGLPDRYDNTNLADLQNAVKVTLHDRNNRFITELPITSQLATLKRRSRLFAGMRDLSLWCPKEIILPAGLNLRRFSGCLKM